MLFDKQQPDPVAGRTFAVAMGVLGALALGLVAAAGVALVRGLDLPDELPPRTRAANLAAPPAASPEAAHAVPLQPGGAAAAASPPIPAIFPPAPAGAADADRPGTIYDPEVLEFVELGIALRREGDTAGALQKLRQADALHPLHPRILWELVTVYQTMSLPDKAEAALGALRELGPVQAGEYYELAAHTLGSSAAANAPLLRQPDFSFGDSLTLPDSNLADGQQVTVRLAIRSALGDPVDARDVGLVMQFYDLVDGREVDDTRSDPPHQRWPTAPVDWADTGTEIVEWTYRMPVLTPEEIAAVGQREYYGFVARLYYRDALQDVLAAPRTLLAEPVNESTPLLDDALFPPAN